ncbi:sensor histidine kinase [Pararhizobium haloflavum]|uniref:sensor histidine kinase n=1 Tax=Pararhizobium haloflavum TaxID=2037914 RepID=UPI000C1908A1|nr:PAS domain-containing sensor histidine kinase [Pararhizobium haloflavum]
MNLPGRLVARLSQSAAGWVESDLGAAERLAQTALMRALLIGVLAVPVAMGLLVLVGRDGSAMAAVLSGAALCLGAAAALSMSGSRAAAVALASAGLLGLLAWQPGEWLAVLFAPITAMAAVSVRPVVGEAPSFEEKDGEERVPMNDAYIPPSQTFLDSLPGLAALHDARGQVTRFGGLDAPQFLTRVAGPAGRGFLDHIHVSDRLSFLAAIDRLRQGARRETVELRFARKDGGADGGQFAHVVADLVAMRDETGALREILSQCRFSDDVAQLRTENRQLAERSEGADAEKTRFLAAVSHEMRTPLNAIIGFSDILRREYFGALTDDRQRDYVELINQSGEHLLAVVNTMLDMSKIETGRYQMIGEPFRLGELIDDCRRMMTLSAEEKGLRLTARVSRSIDELTADRRAIKQILINLVGNAIKFTDDGGLVTIDAERRGSKVRLTVGDTGAGMAPDLIARIGEPFVQGEADYDRRHMGTGLGLCLVKGLVGLHGGEMTVQSEPGRGTAVTIELPLDGSGIVNIEDEGTGQTVDFPPRLKRMEYEPRTEDAIDDAQAKTA